MNFILRIIKQGVVENYWLGNQYRKVEVQDAISKNPSPCIVYEIECEKTNFYIHSSDKAYIMTSDGNTFEKL